MKSNFDNQINTITGLIAKVRTLISNRNEAFDSLLDDDLYHAHEKILFLLDRFEGKIETMDYLTSYEQQLNGAHNQINNLYSQLSNAYNNFSNVNNVRSYLGQAENTANALISVMAYFHPERDSLEDVDKLSTSIGRKIGGLKTSITRYEQKYEEAVLETKAIINELNKTSEEVRTTINGQREEFIEQKAVLMNELEQKSNTYFDERMSKIDSLVKDLELSISKSATLYMNSDYSTHASESDKKVKNWMIGSVISAIATIAVYYFMFGVNPTEDLGVSAIVFRTINSLTLGAITVFSLSQVKYFQKMATYYKRMATDLRSIDPYLADFTDSERNSVKKILSENFFATARDTLTSKEIKNDTNAILGTVELMSDVLKKDV